MIKFYPVRISLPCHYPEICFGMFYLNLPTIDSYGGSKLAWPKLSHLPKLHLESQIFFLTLTCFLLYLENFGGFQGGSI